MVLRPQGLLMISHGVCVCVARVALKPCGPPRGTWGQRLKRQLEAVVRRKVILTRRVQLTHRVRRGAIQQRLLQLGAPSLPPGWARRARA